MQKRFTHIVNHLMGLGKEFDKEELNIKVLKCLDRNWQPKVTTISESKDLSIITTAALFGKLREHEIEMQRLNELETSEKKVKSIALKASSKKGDEIEEKAAKSSDNENLNLLVKKFGKYLNGKATKVIKRGTILNKMIQVILLNSHVITLESKDISRLNVLMLTKRRRRLMI